jgi:hypothetical protein
VLPWKHEGDAVMARMMCDVCTPDGKPYRIQVSRYEIDRYLSIL